MTKTELINSVSRSVHKVGFRFKKHMPEIMVITGVVGVATSAVLACKATTKIDSVLAEPKEKINQIHNYVEENGCSEKYTEEDYKKDLAIMEAKKGLQLVKLYAPSVSLGLVSIGLIFAGYGITHKRSLAYAAAYAAEHAGFKDYRNRVIERFGQELDRELRYNIKSEEIEEIVTNEDGTETVVKNTVEVANPVQRSEYTFCFDETCKGWTRNAEANKSFLLRAEAFANQKLQQEGYLFLNDVLVMLGFEKTATGQIAGWVYDNPDGDGHVDFGMFDIHDKTKRRFMNGYEKSIWLDFNVDGPILNAMK